MNLTDLRCAKCGKNQLFNGTPRYAIVTATVHYGWKGASTRKMTCPECANQKPATADAAPGARGDK